MTGRDTFSDPSGNPNFGATDFCKDNNQLSCTLVPTQISRPDGKTVTLSWGLNERCATEFNPDGSLDCEYDSRLGGVSNSYGYSIGFTTRPIPRTVSRRQAGTSAPELPFTTIS